MLVGVAVGIIVGELLVLVPGTGAPHVVLTAAATLAVAAVINVSLL